jgi:putative peptidoglycan lipid II flippase
MGDGVTDTSPTNTERSVLSSAVSPALGTALSRVTGLVRVMALAAALGQGGISDAYNFANTAPNLLYELVLGGVLSSTLIPLFVRRQDESEHQATERASVVLSVGVVALVALSVLTVAAAPLVKLFEGDKPSVELDVVVKLLPLLLPQILFYGVTSIGTAMLHARRRYAAAAFAPVLTNVITTVAFLLVIVVASAGAALDSAVIVLLLGLGTTAGVAAMAWIVVRALRAEGSVLEWRFRPRHPVIREIFHLGKWTIGYVIANQVALLVVMAVAATNSAGAVTAYITAFIFFQLPHGLIAVSVMTSTTPELAATAAAGDSTGFARRFREGSLVLITLMLPAAVGLFAVSRPLVAVLLERGRFNAEDTARTAEVLRTLAVGLPGFSLYLLTLRVFTATKDTRTPFFLNLLENFLNIVIVLALGHTAAGLGAAYTGAYTAAAVVTLWWANTTHDDLIDRSWLKPLGRAVAIAVTLAGVLAVASRVLSGSGALSTLVVETVVGSLVVVVAIVVLKPEGFAHLGTQISRLVRRVVRAPSPDRRGGPRRR